MGKIVWERGYLLSWNTQSATSPLNVIEVLNSVSAAPTHVSLKKLFRDEQIISIAWAAGVALRGA